MTHVKLEISRQSWCLELTIGAKEIGYLRSKTMPADGLRGAQ